MGEGINRLYRWGKSGPCVLNERLVKQTCSVCGGPAGDSSNTGCPNARRFHGHEKPAARIVVCGFAKKAPIPKRLKFGELLAPFPSVLCDSVENETTDLERMRSISHGNLETCKISNFQTCSPPSIGVLRPAAGRPCGGMDVATRPGQPALNHLES